MPSRSIHSRVTIPASPPTPAPTRARTRTALTATLGLLTSLGPLGLYAPTAAAQSSSSGSSSSSSSQTTAPLSSSTPSQKIAQPEASGSAVTLESSESLFQLAAALNTCGYDADLAASSPIRASVRAEIDAAVAASPDAAARRNELCAYIHQHQLGDPGRSVAQYVSLALYLLPDLTPIVAETDLPPDSTQVVTVLPLLRNFSEAVHLHAIWVARHADYEAIVTRLHDPLTRMILHTNIDLRSPVSSYDGRRFLVLVEPMLAPNSVNARIYSSNYVVIISPPADPAGSFHLDEIRHTYLHYQIEPMVYARAAAMDRLLPLLKSVAEAPLEFVYKSDIVALFTECLIKAVEARTMETGLVQPARPAGPGNRVDSEKFDAERAALAREAEAVRRRSVDLSMRQGWVLTNYFYGQLVEMERDNISLKDNIGPMVYGMDVERQRKAGQQIAFLPEPTRDVVRRIQPAPSGLDLAERKMLQGDAAAAEEIARKALADPVGDHPRAHYILARIDLLDRQPAEAVTHFQAALQTSKDPRTIAWSHIYLGRLYDVQSDRGKAVSEYHLALNVHDIHPDTRAAADQGLKQPFTLPKRETVVPATSRPASQSPANDDEAPLDPSGKAEKEAYKPQPR